MRVAVVGAGIGGLVLAAGLQRDGHRVRVHERRADAGTSGAGLTLFGNAFAALDAVGLGDDVRAVSGTGLAGLRAGQRRPSGRWLAVLPPEATASSRSVHRADLHRVLLARLQDGSLRTGSPVTVSGDGSPVLRTPDGEEEHDLVVAADGLRSTSRRVLGLDTGTRPAGYTAWRGVTRGPLDVGGQAGETWGRGQRFGIVPLPDGRVYWFATATTPGSPESPASPASPGSADEHDAVRERFATWHDPVPACVDATAREDVLRHDVHDLARPLASFVKGRTVLLGDAAHAMTPDLGQGAGQAVEDAATLVVLLRSNPGTGDGLAAALARYDHERRRRTAVLARRSRLVGAVGQLSHPLAVAVRDGVLRATPAAALARAAEQVQRWTPPAPARR
ncbi:FAD-dependent monooxygenase [Kineococcus radiotolerans]|nr:FAD-dependent monooxygenase [Kineococcus radiotolerans]